jgi:outer membrane protein TolC
MKEKAAKLTVRYLFNSFFILMIWIGLTLPGNAVTLEECIRTSLENNPDVQAGLARIQAAKSMIKQAQSAYYPRLYMSGMYSVTDNPPQAFMMELNQKDLDMRDPGFDPNDPDVTDNLRFSLGLQYRLYNGGINVLNIHMAEEEKVVKDFYLAGVQNELIHQVTRGYYGVLQAQAFVSVQEESVKSLEENLRVANARFHAGSAVKTDVLNLDVKLAQAREDLILAQNSVQLAIASLNTAIGKDLVALDGLSVPLQEELEKKSIRLDYTVIENRPELQAAKKMSEILSQSYEKVTRERYPTVSAFGSYDVDSGDASDFENSYLVGVMAKWEFFDGYQRSNKAQTAKADWRAAKREEEKATNNLRLDLHQSFLKASEAWQRLEVTKKSVENAKEALRITGEQYKEGAADITILLTAQVGLTAQKTRNVAAYYDYLTALSNFERASGQAVKKYVP